MDQFIWFMDNGGGMILMYAMGYVAGMNRLFL
jgi:hypothetical protein